jgi:hypothetical protein
VNWCPVGDGIAVVWKSKMEMGVFDKENARCLWCILNQFELGR